jgi:hypothetical protein
MDSRPNGPDAREDFIFILEKSEALRGLKLQIVEHIVRDTKLSRNVHFVTYVSRDTDGCVFEERNISTRISPATAS